MHHDPVVAQTLVRLVQMIQLGRIKTVDASGNVATLQVDLGPQDANGSLSLVDKIPFLQQFGFASVPPADSEVLVACLNGERSAPVALGTNNRQHRPPEGMQVGDSALYDSRGAYAWFGENGLVIDAAGLDVTVQNAANVTVTATTLVTLDAPNVKVTHNLEVDGNITAPSGSITALGTIRSTSGDVTDQTGPLSSLRQAYDGHKHTGVTTGGGTSGPTTQTV